MRQTKISAYNRCRSPRKTVAAENRLRARTIGYRRFEAYLPSGSHGSWGHPAVLLFTPFPRLGCRYQRAVQNGLEEGHDHESDVRSAISYERAVCELFLPHCSDALGAEDLFRVLRSPAA